MPPTSCALTSYPEDAQLAAWTTVTQAPLGYVDRYGLSQIRSIIDNAGAALSQKPVPSASPASAETPADDDQGVVALQGMKDDEAAVVVETLDEFAALEENVGEPKIDALTMNAAIDAVGMREKFIAEYHPPLGSGTARHYVAVDSKGKPIIWS